MKPKVQVALDLTDTEQAIEIGTEAVKGGVDWIEAGTPLIKSEGVEAIEKLDEEFPEKTIIADMKTIDTGELEVSLAAEAGADIVSILGHSADKTIEEAVKISKKYNIKIISDLITVSEPYDSVERLEDLGVDYIGIHTGIDQQKTGKSPLKELKPVLDKATVPIAIAGGLEAENSAKAIEEGASIVIVGSAITKAEDPAKEAEKIVNNVRNLNG